MQGHRIVTFFGPGLAMCSRCERAVDVYEWSEPCEAMAPIEAEATARASDAALVAS